MLRNLTKSTVLRNAGKLMSGRVGAMLIGVAATPVIARLFVPSDYGIAALFISIATVAASILPAGYQRAILYPENELVATRLLLLAIASAAGMVAVVYVAYFVASAVGTEWSQGLGIANLLWALPIAALVLALRDALAVGLLRQKRFAALAWMDVGQSGTIASTRILWGFFFGSSSAGLIGGQLFGFLFAGVIAFFLCWPWVRRALDGFSWRQLTTLAAEFKDYPVFRVPARLAFIAADQLPVIALGLIYPAASVGFFAMANRVAGLPLQAASRSLSDAVLRKSIGDRHEAKAVAPGILKAAVLLVLIGLPIFLSMYFIGGDVLEWFLGARWVMAGQMLEILAPLLFFSWTASAFTPVFETFRQNKLQLMLHWLSLGVRAAAFYYCYTAGLDILAALWLFVVVGSLHQLLVIAMALGVLRRHEGYPRG